MSLWTDLTNFVGNPLGNMAFTTPNSDIGQASALAGGAYLGGQGLMGLDSSAAEDPFSASSVSQLNADFGGGGSGGIFGELGMPNLSGITNPFSDISSIINGINTLRGGSGGGTGNSLLNAASNDPSLAMRVLPGVMALGYAASQPNLDLSQLNNLSGELAGNQNAVIKAATDPLQANIAGGYGDLLQSQALRGIRGSSFGDTDIANYLSNTGNALANAGANAAQGSLALQGSLASEIAALQNQRQQTKNNLYGQAFDVLGRGLNPQGYAANLGGYGLPGMPTAPQQPNKLNTLLGMGNSIGNVIGDVGKIGSSIGHFIGGLF